MALDWSPFVDLVRRHQRFLLTTHVRPDSDGLGSILAMAEVLRLQGKETRLTVASLFPPRCAFLDPQRTITHFEPPGNEFRDADVILVMDTGTWNQLGAFGPFLKASPAAKVVIDHHMTQDDLGALLFVDRTAEATGRLAYEAIKALGATLTPTMANNLFVAVATDTGWFRHSNASAETFALAAELVRTGARPETNFDQIYERNTLARIKLQGLASERMQLAAGGRVAHTEIRGGDYEATGATPQDTEDLVNLTRSIIGVEVGLLFVEQLRGGVKVSFRSRGVDVARIAEQFGGGGHRLASGATIEASLDDAKARVLKLVSAALHTAG